CACAERRRRAMWRCYLAGAVCTPQYAVSGIARLPIESVSVRVGEVWAVRGVEAVDDAEAFDSVIVVSHSHTSPVDRSGPGWRWTLRWDSSAEADDGREFRLVGRPFRPPSPCPKRTLQPPRIPSQLPK